MHASLQQALQHLPTSHRCPVGIGTGDSPSVSLIEAVTAQEYRKMVGPSHLKPVSPKPTALELPNDHPEPTGANGAVIEDGIDEYLGGNLRDSETPGPSDSGTVKLKASPWTARRSLSAGRGAAKARRLSEERTAEMAGGTLDEPMVGGETQRGYAKPVWRFFLTQLLPALASLWSFCVRHVAGSGGVGEGSKQQMQKGGGGFGATEVGGMEQRRARAAESRHAEVRIHTEGIISGLGLLPFYVGANGLAFALEGSHQSWRLKDTAVWGARKGSEAKSHL